MGAGTTNPLISIVIVNYNGESFLRPCLQSVFAQSYRPIDVVFVDNASSDGSIGLVEREFPDVRIVRCDENLGFAGGNNVGVQAAAADYIVLLNNDTTVQDEWLPPLVEALQRPLVAVVTSKVITDGIPKTFYQMNGTLNYLGHNIMRQFADLSEIFYAGGTSMMFRKSLVGIPFLNEYFLYQEDVYLSWRWRLRGYQAMMAPTSIVHHRGNATTKKETSALITFHQERNRILNLLLFYERRILAKLAPLFALDFCLKITHATFSTAKSLSGTVKAYWWLVKHRQKIAVLRTREQAGRTVPDVEILKKMSPAIFDDERTPFIAWLPNLCARVYARLVGLPYHVPESTV